MRPSCATESTMFSGLVSRTSFRSFGSTTGIDVVTTGMVIRKMISSTSITSTSGVVLMVDTTSSSSDDEPTFIAMASGPDGLLLRAQQHGVQVGAEAAHALHRRLVATDDPVVTQHRRHGDREAEGGHDERLAHRSRDLVDRCLAGNADGGQGVIDAPHRPEQSHERRGGADGGQKRQAVLRAALHVLD